MALVLDAVGFDEVGIGAEQRAILLVGGQAGETEQREGLVAGPLGGQEVAVMSAAVLTDQFHPALGKTLEGVDLGWIDHVLNDTSDHRLQASLPPAAGPATAW